jgi:hypothetical protein
MIVLRTDHGPFRLVDVYYPVTYPLNGIGYSPRLNEIVYLRQAPAPLNAVNFVAHSRTSETTLIDLTRDVELVFREMSTTTRRQIRKIERLGAQMVVRRNDRVALQDFRTIYNSFVGWKKHTEQLSEARLNVLSTVADIFVAYFDGRPLCGHTYIRDLELKRVGLLMAASTRFDNGDAPIFVGSVNRWLHWYEMRLYKSEGVTVYDFGGIGRGSIETEGVARFKLSFGGRPVTEYNYIVAGRIGRAAISLFYALRRLRRLNRRINGQFEAKGPTVRLSDIAHLSTDD